MDAKIRRKRILQSLQQAIEPISATTFAQQLEVSRQLIVGDIALLRAQGNEVVATARGYMIQRQAPTGRYHGKIACLHSLPETKQELLAVVEEGAEVLDVLVDHELYGEMTGQLGISTKQDIEMFAKKLHNDNVRLLSELTGGVHLHTIACKDAATFDRIRGKLAKLGLLYQ